MASVNRRTTKKNKQKFKSFSLLIEFELVIKQIETHVTIKIQLFVSTCFAMNSNSSVSDVEITNLLNDILNKNDLVVLFMKHLLLNSELSATIKKPYFDQVFYA